jgi:hypothetical protein
MVTARTSRRGHGEDSIYFDADKNRYVGAVSLGHAGDGTPVRRKVYGKTKQDVRLKLKTLRSDIEAGVGAPASYTVQAAVDDWLAKELSGGSERTLTLYRDGVKPLTDRLGARQLRQLTAAEVRSALAGLSGELSTRSLQIARNCLVRAIRQAQADDIVARNVAALVKTSPAGRAGAGAGESGRRCPARKWYAEGARAVPAARVRSAAADYRDPAGGGPCAAVGPCGPGGRDSSCVAVGPGGDTETARSRRTLKRARIAVEALTARKAIQAADRLKAGELWQDDDLVFTTATGVMLDQRNIRREFRLICKAAGLGTDWVPRDLRHTFVSIMSQGRHAGGGDRQAGWPQAAQHD